MATQNPLLQPGQWVQLAPVPTTWNRPLPTKQEQTIGQVRQAFTTSDGTMYQVVWNPGSAKPQTALYHASQVCAIDQQQTQNVANSMASGTYTVQTGNPTKPTGVSI